MRLNDANDHNDFITSSAIERVARSDEDRSLLRRYLGQAGKPRLDGRRLVELMKLVIEIECTMDETGCDEVEIFDAVTGKMSTANPALALVRVLENTHTFSRKEVKAK